MIGLLELFRAFGGLYVVVLGAFAYVALADTRARGAQESRFRAAVSKLWYGAVAAVVAALAVLEHFMRLWNGEAFVAWSGSYPGVHTVYGLFAAVAIALSVALSLYADRRRRRRARRLAWPPWVSLGLVLTCVVGSNYILTPAPKRLSLSQRNVGDETAVIKFVQKRLIRLACFEEVGEKARADGDFDTATAWAVGAFQQANGLLSEQKYIGKVRPEHELRLLTNPFPWLGTPRPCTAEPPPE